MALPLFWRLTLGYAVILLLSVGTSIYAIVQLGDLGHTARIALDTDYRTIAQQEALTDAFLSEVRYGGKYLLTQSPSSYDQFNQFKSDFLHYLVELKTLATSTENATPLTRIEQLHQSFHELFDREARHLKAGQPYAQSRYQQERDRILDNTLRELARLKDQLETAVQEKLGHLGSTAHSARNIAIATTLILLIIGAALSLKMSSSVTQPLVLLTSKFKNDQPDELATTPPSAIPEIQELAQALAQHRHRIEKAAEKNAGHMERVTDELATRISGLKRQLSEFRVDHEAAIPTSGRESMDALSAEIDAVMRYCAELHAAAVARMEVQKLTPTTAPGDHVESTTGETNGWLMRELPDNSEAAAYPNSFAASRWAKLLPTVVRRLGRTKNDIDNDN